MSQVFSQGARAPHKQPSDSEGRQQQHVTVQKPGFKLHVDICSPLSSLHLLKGGNNILPSSLSGYEGQIRQCIQKYFLFYRETCFINMGRATPEGVGCGGSPSHAWCLEWAGVGVGQGERGPGPEESRRPVLLHTHAVSGLGTGGQGRGRRLLDTTKGDSKCEDIKTGTRTTKPNRD